MPDKTSCYKCVFRGSVPGSEHSSCTFQWSVDMENVPKGHTHAIKNGWWIFPWNYDPIWMKEDCTQFKAKEDTE